MITFRLELLGGGDGGRESGWTLDRFDSEILLGLAAEGKVRLAWIASRGFGLVRLVWIRLLRSFESGLGLLGPFLEKPSRPLLQILVLGGGSSIPASPRREGR
jgi:hypothetical protein